MNKVVLITTIGQRSKLKVSSILNVIRRQIHKITVELLLRALKQMLILIK